jgi:hypothetical protein
MKPISKKSVNKVAGKTGAGLSGSLRVVIRAAFHLHDWCRIVQLELMVHLFLVPARGSLVQVR